MKTNRMALGIFALLLSAASCADQPTAADRTLAPSEAAFAKKSSQSSLLTAVPVVGTLPGSGTFTGTTTITGLALEDGELVVSGVLNGTATVGGVVTNIVDQAFTVGAELLNPGTAKCDILFLDLGPIFLDLLGLEVDLSQIVLDVDAVPGPGNLLGNLLCAVVGLLDNPLANLAGVLNLLDQINQLLG